MKFATMLLLLAPCYLLMCLFVEYVPEPTRLCLALVLGLVLLVLLLSFALRRWTGKPR